MWSCLTFIICLFPAPIKSLRTSLPGELRLAPHAPGLGCCVLVVVVIIVVIINIVSLTTIIMSFVDADSVFKTRQQQHAKQKRGAQEDAAGKLLGLAGCWGDVKQQQMLLCLAAIQSVVVVMVLLIVRPCTS